MTYLLAAAAWAASAWACWHTVRIVHEIRRPAGAPTATTPHSPMKPLAYSIHSRHRAHAIRWRLPDPGRPQGLDAQAVVVRPAVRVYRSLVDAATVAALVLDSHKTPLS